MISSLLKAAESQLSFRNDRQFSNIIRLSKDGPDGVQGRPAGISGLVNPGDHPGSIPENQITSMSAPF